MTEDLLFDRKVQVTVGNLLTKLKNADINVVININFKISLFL